MNILEKNPKTGQYTTIAEHIDRMVAGSGLSQNKLLEEAGVSASTVSAWKRGESLKTIEILRKLAEAADRVSPCEAQQAFEGIEALTGNAQIFDVGDQTPIGHD